MALLPQTGSNRVQNTATNSGDVLVFLSCLMHVWWLLGVLILPKWLIKVPGHISILFGTCLELPKKTAKKGPSDPLFITEILSKYIIYIVFVLKIVVVKSGDLRF